MVLGGLRALLLQAVHPLAMAGVAKYSDYRIDPWGRLRRTAEFVAVTTYGETPQALAAAARVRGVHRNLGGTEPESGTDYRVDDPDLLRWVHVCEAESFLSTYLRSGATLDRGGPDRYYDEMQRSAALLGCLDVPRSVAEVADYLRDVQPQLRVTAAAREATRFIINPPMPRWVTFGTPAKAGWWSLGAIAVGLLPRWARRLYSLPGLPTTDLGASFAARVVRTGFLAVPANVREGPALRTARARLSGKPEAGPRVREAELGVMKP